MCQALAPCRRSLTFLRGGGAVILEYHLEVDSQGEKNTGVNNNHSWAVKNQRERTDGGGGGTYCSMRRRNKGLTDPVALSKAANQTTICSTTKSFHRKEFTCG